jgi:sugar-specific transcriptional regulator TrmB
VIDRLSELGFSSQEARVYVALLQQPSATGYEVAKSAGLQRANVYQVLASLAERNVVARISADAPARFVALPPADVLGRIKRQTAERADSLIADLAAMAAPREQAAFFTLRDREAVIDRSAALVAEATKRVAVCAWAADLDWLAGPLRAASQSGCQVVVNVFGDADLDFGEVYRHESPARTVGGHLLTLAVDFTTALVASLDEPAGAVFTSHPALVRVVEKLIRDETYLAAIYDQFPAELDAAFGPHLVNLRTRLLPPDQAEQLISIVGFGAEDTAVAELLTEPNPKG